MKVFIGHLMYNKTSDEILSERELMEKVIKEAYKDEEIEILESYFTDYTPETTPLEFLGKVISVLSKADIAVFMHNAYECKGCRVEMKCCREYGITTRYLVNTGDGYIITADISEFK